MKIWVNKFNLTYIIIIEEHLILTSIEKYNLLPVEYILKLVQMNLIYNIKLKEIYAQRNFKFQY